MRRDQLYGRRWRKGRRQFLVEHPLCAMCLEEGTETLAVEVDHIIPHKGDPVLFWDTKNWQGLCKFHHQSIKARMERGGKRIGNRMDGTPLDPKHHWNAG